MTESFQCPINSENYPKALVFILLFYPSQHTALYIYFIVYKANDPNNNSLSSQQKPMTNIFTDKHRFKDVTVV